MSTTIRFKRIPATLLALTSIISSTPLLPGPDVSRPIYAQRADTIVRPIGQPIHAGIAPLVEEVSIGVADGPPEQTFSSIAEIAIGPDGSIFVLDRPNGGTPFLRQYDAAGRFLRTIGRAGDGPGEYRAPSGLAVLRDGRVLLRGAANHRINVYDRGGEPVESWRLNETGTSTGQNMVVVDTGGTIWVRTPSRFLPGGTVPPPPFARFTSAGALIDTVRAPEIPNPPPLLAQGGNVTTSIQVPYTPQVTFALSPLGYFVTGFPSRYAVELRVPPRRAGPPVWRAGDPVISLRREQVPSVPVPDAERDARREDIEARLRRTDPSWRWSGMDIPRVKTPYATFRVANDGRIWVLTSQPSERFDPANDALAGAPVSISGGVGGGGRAGSAGAPRPAPPPPVPWRSPAVYDVLEPDGRWIGQVRIPYGVTAHVMQGDHVWASTADEDGVPYVKRYRIAWGGR